MRADSDLPWYFGSGPSTWAGDSGIRSTMGAQIAQLNASSLSKEAAKEAREYARTVFREGGPRDRWIKRPHQIQVVDASQAEDDMVERFAAAARVNDVQNRLSTLSVVQARTLQLHYSGLSLPFSLSPAVALLGAARKLCGTDTEPDSTILREALKKAPKLERESLDHAGQRLVVAARLAYEGAQVPRPTRPRFVQDWGRG